MRRQHKNADHVYGAVELCCPDGHILGKAIVQEGRYTITPALVRIDGPNGETKLKARCDRCEHAGIHRDLQASWDTKLVPLLGELEKDITAGVFKLTIGG